MPDSEQGEFEAEIFGLPVRNAPVQPADGLDAVLERYLQSVRDGQAPPVDEYARRHPQLAKQLRDLLPLVSAMEHWKSAQELAPSKQSMTVVPRFEQLGNCRVLREIGRGGMGVVFEAEQQPIGRRVAVKVLPWRFPRGSRWRERFEREARTAARLQHPHIVPVFQFGEQDGWCYYVMHLVEGLGLDRVIDLLRESDGVVRAEQIRQLFHRHTASEDKGARTRGVLYRDSWTQLARVGVHVADALRYAHAQGTIHRDIKPANLILDTGGVVWITDFGVALEAEQLLQADSPDIAGTLKYLAPEQLEGIVDNRSDLYALGVTLYELLTLRPAFDGSSRDLLVAQITAGRATTLRSINPAIPRELQRIVLRAMHRDPAERYQTAEALMSALLDFVRDDRKSPWWRRFGG